MEQVVFQFKPNSFDKPHTSFEAASLPRREPVPASGTAVIIATRGRPGIVRALVTQLGEQSQPPEHIFVIGSTAGDVAGLNPGQANLTVRVGRPGSSPQRNDGLALAGSRFSYVVFFDDDFVPSRFWLERMHMLFESRPGLIGLTGNVLADGTTTEGIRLEHAQAMVRMQDSRSAYSRFLREFGYGGNMGCNMAFRASALRGAEFDERLPLYAWLEDADFRAQVEQRGSVLRADILWGVHLGHKMGRGRGLTLGYSQMANAAYLARKGTVPLSHLIKTASRNLISNTVRSLWPEPYVDRRGRLQGNLLALADLARGRIAPERVLEL
jgi:hypothetical protein